jgi:hypothetical protein
VVKADWNASPRDKFMVRFSRDASDAVVSQEHPLFLEYRDEHEVFTAQHEHVRLERGELAARGREQPGAHRRRPADGGYPEVSISPRIRTLGRSR